MTDILIIDDNHGVQSIVRLIANRYGRLAAFSVVWALVNIVLVDIVFDRAFNEQPFQIVKFLTAIH